MSQRLFSFPNPVNETSARLVASGAFAQAVLFLTIRQWWVLVPLVYGFAARVLSGPRFSPLGILVTKVITPRVGGEQRFVAGPPKRFAQGVGLVFSSVGLIAWVSGAHTLGAVMIAGLAVAASLEAFAGFCLGCVMFSWLIRAGVIPQSVCRECSDITGRINAQFSRSAA